MVTMLILHLSLSVVYILPFLSYPITIIADVILMFVLLHEYVREMAFYYGGKAYWEKYRGGFFRHALLAVFVSRRKTDENVAFPEFGYSLLRHVRESRWIWDPDADARQQFYESPISARLERSGLGTRLDADVNSKLGRHYLLRMLRAPTDKADSNQLIRKMRCLLHLGGRLPLELDRCLSERLLMLSFVMGQSLVRFSHRWAEHADLSDSDKKDVLQWGSGQIIAVVVLIAPLFSWVHAFYGKELHPSASHTLSSLVAC
ncbi:hypothetical protein BJ508DRAFT_171988 [Ascobolus immersus RN42]|uniref:Uncharacterized protein n=1 Tax=Ascobolus immersus RN42 TaxID=1160509 RepID=A0A3N4HUH6_ASCIM|nr:hypothetical protein BJ508DRAFT_171988 [Ascobolus immersus RN42]